MNTGNLFNARGTYGSRKFFSHMGKKTCFYAMKNDPVEEKNWKMQEKRRDLLEQCL